MLRSCRLQCLFLLVLAAGCPPPEVLLQAISLDPTQTTVQVGQTTVVTAQATYTDGTKRELAKQATWTSSDARVATVAEGVVTGVSVGSATIGVSFEGKTAQATVTVIAVPLQRIEVTPANASIAVGTTRQLTATGVYADSRRANLTSQVTWTSSAPSVVSVDSSGMARAVSTGNATITATSGTIRGTAALNVTAASLVSLAITPPTPSIAVGTTQQLTATGTFSDTNTQDLSSQVAWTSSDPNVATVSTSGLATAVTAGTTTITATLGTVHTNILLTVTGTILTSIAVTPTNPSVARGSTQQFVATGTYSDNSTQNITTAVTWSSSVAATATISNTAGTNGVATAVAVGTTVITATLGAVSGNTNFTITPATLVSIAVTPPNPSVSRGSTQQFTATGTYSDTTTQDITTAVTWASSVAATATISNAAGSNGLATAVAVGTTAISATLGAVSGNTNFTVTPATLVSIAVTPPNQSVSRGSTQQFTATGTYSDTTTQDITTAVTWASSVEATATISNATGTKGLATAVAVGTTAISATLGAVSGNTNFTVTPATLVSIAVTPPNPSVSRGSTQQFTATGTFSDTTTQDITTAVTWASSVEATATISNATGTKGLATAVAVGTTVITATQGAVSGSTNFTVTPATLVSIAVTPPNPSVSRGATQQFTATGTYSDTTTQDITTAVTWASSVETTATISNATGTKGLATAVAVGTTVITATLGAVSGSTNFTVTPATLVSIAVTPPTPTIAAGGTQQFIATGTYSDSTTQVLTTQVTWGSSMTTVATVSNADGSRGLATGVASGTTEISAALTGVTGTTTLSVAGAPAVASTSPASGASNVVTPGVLSITFSTAMLPASLTVQTAAGACSGSIQLSQDDFATCLPFAGPPVMNVANTVATVTPAPALSFGQTFVLRVTTGATSAQGSPLPAAYTQSPGFTTGTDTGCGPGVVISQVFGGGGSASGTYTGDLVELHNRGTTPVDVSGWSVQYASAAGTSWAVAAIPPSTTMPPGGYLLVLMATGAGIGPPPTPDVTAAASIAMSATAGKVALMRTLTALSGACPASADLVDRVGYGSTANCSETAPTAPLSATTSGTRIRAGCVDTDNNGADLTAGTPALRNSASPINVCACVANEVGSAAELDFCNLQFPASFSVQTATLSPTIYSRAYEAGATEPPGPAPGLIAQVGYGPVTVNPQNQAGFSWFAAGFNVQVGNDDEWSGSFTAPGVGVYAYTSRYSFDGQRWTYCDLDGTGANASLAFSPFNLGVMTVTP